MVRCYSLSNIRPYLHLNTSFAFLKGQGATALHKAAIFGHLAVVKKLVECGANINAADAAGETALHYASKCGFPLLVRCLIDAGAGMTKNAAGHSPKDVAANSAIQQMFVA